MGSPGKLVAPPLPRRGMLGLALCLGALAGVVAVFVSDHLSEDDASGAALLLATAFVFSPLAFGVVLALGLAAVTQHRAWVFALGAAYGVALWVSAEVAGVIAYTDVLAIALSAWDAVGVLVAAPVGGLGALGVRWVVRAVGFVLVEQNGRLCWRCGYDLGLESVPNCRQCGSYVEPGRYRMAPVRWFVAIGRRMGWPAFVVIMVVQCAWLSSIWSSHIRPKVEAANQMGAIGQLWPGAFWEPGTNAMSAGSPCPAAKVDLVGQLYLMVARPPQPRADGTILQVQLICLMRDDGAWGVSEWSNGAPRVLCNLNAAQAAEVEKQGVPASLKDAFVNASGGISWMGSSLPVPPDIAINPAPHFPQ